MACKKNWNKMELAYLCIHLTYLLCFWDSQVSDGCLKVLKMVRIVLFVFFLIELVLFDSKFIFYLLLSLLLLAWILFDFEKSWHKRGSLFTQPPGGCCLQKWISNGFWRNLSANISETLVIIENFKCLFCDSRYIDFYALYRFMII